MKNQNSTYVVTPDDKQRIYQPWKYSVIVKLIGRKIPHQYLKNKLNELWKPFENLILINIGWDFFIAKFNRQENMEKAIQGGPWFILGNFLSVRHWEPNFAPQESTITYTTIWVRLPQLPTEF